MIQSVCVSCKKPYVKNSRQKKQKYCSDPSCQKARKAKWQRDNLKSSPIYRKDQLQANKDWHSKEPDYWKTYRKKNPQKTLRNTLLQRKRNQKRCLNSFGRLGGNVKAKLIAKMDVLIVDLSSISPLQLSSILLFAISSKGIISTHKFAIIENVGVHEFAHSPLES